MQTLTSEVCFHKPTFPFLGKGKDAQGRLIKRKGGAEKGPECGIATKAIGKRQILCPKKSLSGVTTLKHANARTNCCVPRRGVAVLPRSITARISLLRGTHASQEPHTTWNEGLHVATRDRPVG